MGWWRSRSRTAWGAVLVLVACGDASEDGDALDTDSDGAMTDGADGADDGNSDDDDDDDDDSDDDDDDDDIPDACPDDPDKTEPGACGCGTPDDDADVDGTPDCIDECPDDPGKTEPGVCGCGVGDEDGDGDSVLDCLDNCAGEPNELQGDVDGDSVGDACDNCQVIPNTPQVDDDLDGVGEACACDPTPLLCDPLAETPLYPCQGIDMLARLSREDLGFTGPVSDMWGWTDDAGNEYALVGGNNGTVFVDLRYPYCPRTVGHLPTQTNNGPLRDIKVRGDYAFIVAEADSHGLQIFDLTRLADAPPGTVFEPDAHYTGFGHAHNVIVDTEAGYAYGVGTSTCNGGLHGVDISDPLAPTTGACFGDVGYIHDAQCVVYDGPDVEHVGKPICVIFNGFLGSISVVDMTDQELPVELSRTPYSGSSFAHQGWLTEDHAHLLHNDELDENNGDGFTRTFLWNMTDLDAPEVIDVYTSAVIATDHNLYTHEGLVYQANYRAGVRVLDYSGIAAGQLSEVAWFDTDASGDGPQLDGAFTAFPWFPSGLIAVSDMQRGLFVLQLASSGSR